MWKPWGTRVSLAAWALVARRFTRLRACSYRTSSSYLQSRLLVLSIEKGVCPENGRAARGGKAVNGETTMHPPSCAAWPRPRCRVASVVSSDRENRALRASQAPRMQVPYKLDGGVIKPWVALRASIGSSLPEFSGYGNWRVLL